MDGSRQLKISTDYSYEQLREFQKFRDRGERTAVVLIGTALAALFTADMIVRLAAGEGAGVFLKSVPGLLLCAGLFILLYGSLDGWFYSRVRHSATGKIGGGGQTQIFGKESFIMASSRSELPTRREIPYGSVRSIWETPEMFYLCVNGRQTFLVDKNGFLEGTPEELAELLRERTKARFRIAGWKGA